EYENSIVRFQVGDPISRNAFLHQLVNALYQRSQGEFSRGTFRVKGDTVDINLPYVDAGTYAIRVTFFDNEIENIETFEPSTGKRIQRLQNAAIFPANMYVAPTGQMQTIIQEIQNEMFAQE